MGAMQGMGTVSAEEVAANPTMPGTVEQQKQQWLSGTNGYLVDAVVKEVAAQGLTVLALDGSRPTLTTTDQVSVAGLSIVSTIDAAKQKAAVDAMADTDNYPTRGRPDTVRAGLVSIDPATGGVLAMYGGPDASNPAYAYNSITRAKAQAGSTFKPITLLAALDDSSEDITLSTTFSGKSPQTFAGAPVANFGGEQFGEVNLVKATQKSVNTAYMELNEEIGPETTAAAAEALGITMDGSAESAVSNVLGSSSVSPLEMAQAYAALANGGDVRKAHFVKSVSADGNDYLGEDTRSTRPFSDDAVNDTVYAMQSVTKAGGTASSVGKAFGKRPVAGKTGTTNDNKAAWFNGFTPQLQTAVVLYNSGPDGEELPLGSWGGAKQITGGSFPAKIWTAYMTQALDDTEIEQFPAPSKQISSEPTPTATPTPTPTETATATPTEDPSASPSESPTDGETGATDGPSEEADDAQAAGPPSIADRASARLGAAAQAAQGGPGQGRGAGAAGPGAGRAQG